VRFKGLCSAVPTCVACVTTCDRDALRHCAEGTAHKAAAQIAGGTHHAFAGWGEGFCVFNDIAVVGLVVDARAKVRTSLDRPRMLLCVHCLTSPSFDWIEPLRCKYSHLKHLMPSWASSLESTEGTLVRTTTSWLLTGLF